jgi:hypothetical protein
LRFAKLKGLEICGRDSRFTDKRYEILDGDWDLPMTGHSGGPKSRKPMEDSIITLTAITYRYV